MHRIKKTYPHSLGLSACFRQHRATSHCRFIHGYALEIELQFAAPVLNDNNWVIDYGSLKAVKAWLQDTFDHKFIVAEDDPALPLFRDMNEEKSVGGKLVDLLTIPFVGCEGFAEYVYSNVHFILVGQARDGLLQGGTDNNPFLESVTVREHAGNCAIYTPQYIIDLNGRAVNYVR